MADEDAAPKRRYFRCPDCSKVSYFKPDEPMVCRQCGFGAEADAEPAAETVGPPLGAMGLGAAAIALLTVFFTPFAALFAITAIVLGGLALGNASDEQERTMGIVALVLGVTALMVVLFFMTARPVYIEGSTTTYEGGSSYENDGGGGSSGGGGGSSGGGGGSSGGGGGGSGGGGGGDVGAPGPGLGLVALAVAIVAWRRR